MIGWVNAVTVDSEPWRPPADLAAGLEAEIVNDCPEMGPRPDHAFMCTRDRLHQGRHIAEGWSDGPEICAAWPGTAEPSAADLTRVPE